MSDASQPTELRALLIAIPDPNYNAYAIVTAVKERLETMFEVCQVTMRHKDKDCTREALVAAMECWVAEAPRGVAHLLYFHGHGGRVSFADSPADRANRITYYLQCPSESGGRSGLLDTELSGWMTELHARCGGNVTVIIDSCHSGGAVKTLPSLKVQVLPATPGWVSEVLASAYERSLAANAHPGIVRLTASSPARWSRLIGGMGRFTRHLLAELKALGSSWPRCSWELLAHRIREQVIKDGLRETQWVSLAGPVNRLLFALAETEPARTVGLIEHEGHVWLRAGSLTGVVQGDRWAALALVRAVDEPCLVHAGILEVREQPQENRSLLRGAIEVKSGPCPRAARLVRAAKPTAVQVVGCPVVCMALPETTWLSLGDAEAEYRVSSYDGASARELLIEDLLGRWAALTVADGPEGREMLLELLEDRARAQRLLATAELIAAAEAESVPIACELKVDGTSLEPAAPYRVTPGQTLTIVVRNTEALPKPHQPWQTYFVSTIMIDPIGRPILLNSGRVDGIELGPEELETIGDRLGGAARGLVIDGPAGWRERFVEQPAEQRIELLLLLSDRPLPLAHLTHAVSGSDVEAFHMQGLDETLAGRGDLTAVVSEPPVHQLARGCAWDVRRFELVLLPRGS